MYQVLNGSIINNVQVTKIRIVVSIFKNFFVDISSPFLVSRSFYGRDCQSNMVYFQCFTLDKLGRENANRICGVLDLGGGGW